MAKLHPKQYGDAIVVDQQTTLQAGDSLAMLMASIRSGKAQQSPKPVTPAHTSSAPAIQIADRYGSLT